MFVVRWLLCLCGSLLRLLLVCIVVHAHRKLLEDDAGLAGTLQPQPGEKGGEARESDPVTPRHLPKPDRLTESEAQKTA
jgi:hypothetical protein